MPAPAAAKSAASEKPETVEPGREPRARSLEPRTACSAPSVLAAGDLDARVPEAIAACKMRPTGFEKRSRECGVGDVRTPFDLARLEAAVLAFDEPTRAHLVELGQRGRGMGRSPRSFGLVGDSITAGAFFLGAFGEGGPWTYALSPEVEAALSTASGGEPRTIIDHYRGAHVESSFGFWRDPFRATRAAKVGARSDWAIFGDHLPNASPIDRMVRRISPSVAVVMYGTNDAAYKVEPLAEVGEAFEARLGKLVDALEKRGVVPILSTIPRHGRSPDRALCDRREGDFSDWRLVLQTNVVNASIAKVACERHLPLVDLRSALDGLVNDGLGWDGVHPTSYEHGSGQLTPDGLQCGYNVRNFVTLLMLKRVKELALDAH